LDGIVKVTLCFKQKNVLAYPLYYGLLNKRTRAVIFFGLFAQAVQLIQAVRLLIFSNLDRPCGYLGNLICTDIRARPNLIVEIAEKSAIDSRSSGQMTHQGNTGKGQNSYFRRSLNVNILFTNPRISSTKWNLSAMSDFKSCEIKFFYMFDIFMHFFAIQGIKVWSLIFEIP